MAERMPPTRIRRFVMLRPEAEAVVQHVGRDTWDLILVDVDGTWTREEYRSRERADDAARALGCAVHEGWSEPRISRRIAREDAWRRPGSQRRAL